MAESREGLWMTAKERDRLQVLHEVKKRHINQKQAAAELGLSVRWVRALLVRWTYASGRGVGRGLWDGDEPGNPAAMADRSQAMASAAGRCRTSPRMACTAGALWRAGAVGYQ
ncbi:MAG: hypothetical protein DMG88_20410 [Acidobacteria bacterium]|nr:MAG: hypothetical protein DMG88_20410 [Acidobacteriota bacterium]